MTSNESAEELTKFFDEVGAEVSKETVEDEVLEAREEVLDVGGLGGPLVLSRTALMNKNKVLVASLRQNDDAHNRTCALCLKRKPIDDFLRLKTSQVCKDCE